MTKKELQERELKLEAIIAAYNEIITDFCNDYPRPLSHINHLEQLNDHLFNAAEVRENISELVSVNVEYEG